LQRNAYVNEVFAELDRQVVIVKPAEVLCDGRSCKALAGDNALYRDRSHPSVQGALLLAPLLSSALAE
jgi:SGNH domain (fused to AT3 domains)